MNLNYPDPSTLKSMKKIKGRVFVDGKRVTYNALKPRGAVLAISELHRRLAMLPDEFTIDTATICMRCNSNPTTYSKLKRLKEAGYIGIRDYKDGKLILYFKTEKCNENI